MEIGWSGYTSEKRLGTSLQEKCKHVYNRVLFWSPPCSIDIYISNVPKTLATYIALFVEDACMYHRSQRRISVQKTVTRSHVTEVAVCAVDPEVQ
jgi:hypothetical protein